MKINFWKLTSTVCSAVVCLTQYSIDFSLHKKHTFFLFCFFFAFKEKKQILFSQICQEGASHVSILNALGILSHEGLIYQKNNSHL